MDELLRRMEKERSKLNALGEKAMEQSIPLSSSQEVQEQSCKVDKLIARYQDMKAKLNEQAR